MKGKGREKNRRMEPWDKSQRRKLKQELKLWMTEHDPEDWDLREEPEEMGNTEKGKVVVQKRRSCKVAKMELIAQDNRCYICKTNGDENKLQFHHVKPVRCGGESVAKNGRLLCGRCHKKYHKLFDEELDNLQGEVEEFVKLFEKQVEKMKKDKN